MPLYAWTKDGKRVVDANGRTILCETCPCDGETSDPLCGNYAACASGQTWPVNLTANLTIRRGPAYGTWTATETVSVPLSRVVVTQGTLPKGAINTTDDLSAWQTPERHGCNQVWRGAVVCGGNDLGVLFGEWQASGASSGWASQKMGIRVTSLWSGGEREHWGEMDDPAGSWPTFNCAEPHVVSNTTQTFGSGGDYSLCSLFWQVWSVEHGWEYLWVEAEIVA